MVGVVVAIDEETLRARGGMRNIRPILTQTLQQIDAVFVTVEPHGGSEKPSGKPLLFAYLKVNANHP